MYIGYYRTFYCMLHIFNVFFLLLMTIYRVIGANRKDNYLIDIIANTCHISIIITLIFFFLLQDRATSAKSQQVSKTNIKREYLLFTRNVIINSMESHVKG